MLSLANMDTGLQAKEKLLSTETNFWRRAPRISRFREVRNVVTRKKNMVNSKNLEKTGKRVAMLWRCSSMESNRRPGRVMDWSLGGRRR
jgi:hypothetical protein